MKMRLAILLAMFLSAVSGQAQEAPGGEERVYREPFTLTLAMADGPPRILKYGKIPYVADGQVFIFKGEEFGLKLDIAEGAVRKVTYEPDLAKADVTLKFTQEVTDGKPMMLLTIHNNTKVTLTTEGKMSVPGKDGRLRTSIVPIGPGLSDYESWPHAISQLMLLNWQVAK